VSVGFVYNQAEPPAQPLRQLETRPLCTGNRCIPTELEKLEWLRIPSFLPDREMPTKDPAGIEHHYHGSAPVALTGMVPNSDGMLSRLPSTSAQMDGLAAGPIQSTPSTGSSRVTKASRLQSIREQYAVTGVSEKASKLLLAGWSTGTNTAYQSGWA